MAEQPEEDDKTEEPTQKRIDDARKKGDIVYSPEVGTAFSLGALAIFAAFIVSPMSRQMGGWLEGMLANAHAYSSDSGALINLSIVVAMHVAAAVGMAFLAFILAGIASRFVQDQPAFSADKLAPKLERLNPIDGAKRVFGPAAFGNFVKALAKMLIVGAAALYVLWPRNGVLETMPTMDVGALLALALDKSIDLIIACLIAAVFIAGADYFFTRMQHRKRLRMTKEELKREYRESEGDPMLKAKVRQLRQERARRRMMQQVPTASVIITNPTHYAIALKYDRETAPAPICVAKGIDSVALKIREIAEEHGVPIVEDPPLARALHAAADLDQVIPRQHFEAVAKIIGYVLRLAEKKRRRGF